MSVHALVIAVTDHDAQATAGTTETFGVGEAQFDGTLTEVSIVPDGAVTADATNNRTFTLQNKGQSGVGTTVMATLVTNVGGGSWVALDEKLMTLTATAVDLNFVSGDVFAVVETVGGTGVAHPRLQLTMRGIHR
jgi:hypothetical protein